MGGPQGRELRPRLAPPATAVITDTYARPHAPIIDHDGDKIRASCTRHCEPGQWRSGKDAYEEVKADWDEQHSGGKR